MTVCQGVWYGGTWSNLVNTSFQFIICVIVLVKVSIAPGLWNLAAKTVEHEGCIQEVQGSNHPQAAAFPTGWAKYVSKMWFSV